MSGYNRFITGIDGGGMGPGGNMGGPGGGNWNSGPGGMGPGGMAMGPGGMMGGNYGGMGGPGWGMGYGMGNMGGMNMMGAGSNQGYGGWNNGSSGSFSGPGNSGNYGPNQGMSNMGNQDVNSGNYGHSGGNYGNPGGNFGNQGGNYDNQGASFGNQGGNNSNTGGNWNKNKGNQNQKGGNYGNFSRGIDSAPRVDEVSTTNNSAMSLSLNLSKQEPSYWGTSGGNNNWQAGKKASLTWSEGPAQGSKEKSGGQNWQGGNKWQSKDSNNSGNKSWQQQRQGQENVGGSGGNWMGSGGNFGSSAGNWSKTSMAGGSGMGQSANNAAGNDKKDMASGYWSNTSDEKGEALMEISDDEDKSAQPSEPSGQESTQAKNAVDKVSKTKKQGTSASSTLKLEKGKEQDVYNCQICSVTVKGLMPYLIHVQGQRHLKAEAEKRKKEQEKNKPAQKKTTSAAAKKESQVQDSRSLGITETPKPSILRNKRPADYPIDPPSENKSGRYDDRPMGSAHSTGQRGSYSHDRQSSVYRPHDDPVPTYSGGAAQSRDQPLVFDYGHSKSGMKPSYDSNYRGPSSADQTTPSGSDNQLQHALNTVLAMVQGSGSSGLNPLASTIQAAIDTRVQEAVSAKLHSTLSASDLPPPSSLMSSSANPPKSDPVFVTPEVMYPEKPIAVNLTGSGLVKIGEGKFATIGKIMSQTRKEDKKKSKARDAENSGEEKEKTGIKAAVMSELSKLGPAKDQEVITNIVSKVVREYMELQMDDKEKGKSRAEGTPPGKSRESEDTSAPKEASDKPPKREQRSAKAPVQPLPNLVPSGKKKVKAAASKPAAQRKLPPPVRFSVMPVKQNQTLPPQSSVGLDDSESESETTVSSGADTSPVTTSVTTSTPVGTVQSVSSNTTEGKTIPVLSMRTATYTAKKEPVPPGTDAGAKAKKEGKAPQPVPPVKMKKEKSGEKVKEKKKKKKKLEKSTPGWVDQFDADFAKKREELDKILSENIAKPKLERKRSDGFKSKGDRVSQIKKRAPDFDSSPYEDISDMSDISSDESDFGDRRVEIVRRPDNRGRGYRGISRSPSRYSPDRLRGSEGYTKPRPRRSRSPSPRLRHRHLSRSPVPRLRRSISPGGHVKITTDRQRERRTPVKERLGSRSSPIGGRRGSPRSSPGCSPDRIHPDGGLVPHRDRRRGSLTSRDRLRSLSPSGKRRTSRERGRPLSPLPRIKDRMGSLTPSEEKIMLENKSRRVKLADDSPPHSRHSSRQPTPPRSVHDRSLSPISDDEKLIEDPEPAAPSENKRGEDWYEQDDSLLQIPAEKITTAYGALLNVLAPGCVQNENDLILATEMIAELTQALVILMEGKVDQEYRDRFIKAADGFANNHGEHPLVAAFHDASNVAPAIIITLSQQEPAFLQQIMQILMNRSDILERVLHSNDQLIDFIKATQEGTVAT